MTFAIYIFQFLMMVICLISCDDGSTKSVELPPYPVTIADPPGGIYNYSERPTVTLKADRPATIYYSMNGDTPWPGRANTLSGSSPIRDISFSRTVTVKFFAIDEKENREAVKSEIYTLDMPPESSASPPGGRFNHPITVTLSANEEGSLIYFSLDGSEPSTTNQPYSSPISISEEGETVIRFFAVDQNNNVEATKSETYTIDKTPPEIKIDPDGGNYNEAVEISIIALDEPATIYYSMDGEPPSPDPDDDIELGGNTYKAENTVTGLMIEKNTILTFFAVDRAGNQGDIQEKRYKIGDAPWTTAVPEGGIYASPVTVTLSAEDEDPPVRIYYTMGGTEPSESSPIYTQPIVISWEGINVLRFFGVDGEGNKETVRTATYTIDASPPVSTASPAGGNYTSPIKVTITANEEATVYYSLDGIDPSPGASNTLAGTSPVTDILIVEDGTVLKYFSVDLIDNRETPVRKQSYGISILFVEDFSTKGRADLQNTSAFWDTAQKRLSIAHGPPTLSGQYETMPPIDMGIWGDYLFAVWGAAGIGIFDISIPSSPSPLNSIYPDVSDRFLFYSIDIDGPYAYVGSASGLVIFDISNPAEPERLSDIKDLCTDTEIAQMVCLSFDVLVTGNTCFVANGKNGLAVIDVSERDNPVHMESYTVLDIDLLSGLLLNGRHLYASDAGDGNIKIFDVADPANITPVKKLTLSGSTGQVPLAIYGNLLIAGKSNGDIRIIDISHPDDPDLKSTLSISSNPLTDILVREGMAYITAPPSGVKVVDFRDPDSPRIISTAGDTGWPTVLASHGNNLFVGSSGSTSVSPGIKVLELRTPSELSVVSTFLETGSNPSDMEAYGRYGYVADGANGIAIMDLPSPSNPIFIKHIPTEDARALHISGSLLLAADGTAGIKAFDLADPASPVLLASAAGFTAVDVITSGRDIYAVAMNEGIKAFDLFDESGNPSLVKTWDIETNDARNIAVYGHYLLIADGVSGIKIMDVSEPEKSPHSFSTPGTALDLEVQGPLCFLAQSTGGMTIYDISNPLAMKAITSLETISAAMMDVAGDDMFLADNEGYLKVIDITFPEEPSIVRATHRGNITGLGVEGDFVYLLRGESGVDVIRAYRNKSDFNTTAAVQSLTVNEYEGDIKWARLNANHDIGDYGAITYKLSNDGGTSWEDVFLNQGIRFSSQGSSLIWRAELSTSDYAESPVINEIRILYRLSQ